MKGRLFIATLACALLPMQVLAAFSYQDVVSKAKTLAASPYKAPEQIPKFMRELGFHDYQNIRFNPEKSLWKESNAQFQVMFLPPGLFYTHPVSVNVVDSQGVHEVDFRKNLFTFADAELEKRVPPDLGFAGFKLTYPFHKPEVPNQFLVFAGASYFRGVGKDNAWGISGRGIAVDTGLASGEEFPSFVEFWLVRPAPKDRTMTFYGLLDGKSLTGAYQFVVTPGKETELKVTATLFPRREVELLGLAPLTSMFFYGENTSRPQGEWRGEVHDSDGLLIHDGKTSEWLWRPLINPLSLQMDYFQTENIRGFGLIQRDPRFASYQDLGAHYEQRPSAWVEPLGDWGKGHVVLVQLPTPDETNDNIVAFWRASQPVKKDQALTYQYRVGFGGPGIADETMGKAVNTFIGDGDRIGGGDVEGSYRVIIDFDGGPLEKLSKRAPVIGAVTPLEGSELVEQFVEYNEAAGAWRLSILAKPAADRPLSLRAYLSEGDRALTETWTYRLPPNNDILPVDN